MSKNGPFKKYITDNRLLKGNEGNLEHMDLGSLDRLIDQNPELMDHCEQKTNSSLLIRAVLNNNYTMCEFLLERGAEPNLQNIYKDTALHHAVENGNHKIINLLLEKGANPNIVQQDGETPMHIAAIRGDYKVIKLLQLFNANSEIRTFNGYSPLDYATEKGNVKCIEVLSKKNIYTDIPVLNLSTRNNINNSFSVNNNVRTFHHERTKSTQIRITKNEYDNSHDSNSFINQMNTFEERLEKIKKELMQVGSFAQISKNEDSYFTAPTSEKNKLTNPSPSTPYLPSEKYNNDYGSNIKNFTLDGDFNRIITLKPDEHTDDFSKVIYPTLSNEDNLFNMPVQMRSHQSEKSSKRIFETFEERIPPLALFISKKNDIRVNDDLRISLASEGRNIKYFSRTSKSLKDDYKHISIDTQDDNTVEVNFEEVILLT
jgi:ankyrin repeat protein